MAELVRRVVRAARLLNAEQRVAAGAAVLLIVSTFGPFSFVEAGEVILAGGVLALLLARAEGKRFHLPFGDGTVIATAGVWAGALIVARILDRPLGQNLLAIVCAAILFLAGVRERAKHPADDVPERAPGGTPPIRRRRAPRRPGAAAEVDATTDPLPPPEFRPYEPRSGEQLHLAPDDQADAPE
ncbi:MAG: hypothetical protein QOI32_31 [Thermoleophilaceae bacterium]|jgi:hypothetical protein|nr:hypothetical protein [Thermoleophilaceae bacterium]